MGTGLGQAAAVTLRHVFLLPLTETTGAFIDKRNDHVGRSMDHRTPTRRRQDPPYED